MQCKEVKFQTNAAVLFTVFYIFKEGIEQFDGILRCSEHPWGRTTAFKSWCSEAIITLNSKVKKFCHVYKSQFSAVLSNFLPSCSNDFKPVLPWLTDWQSLLSSNGSLCSCEVILFIFIFYYHFFQMTMKGYWGLSRNGFVINVLMNGWALLLNPTSSE